MSRTAVRLILILVLLLLTSCFESTPSVPTVPGPTVTLDSHAPSTLTPFAPSTDTPVLPRASDLVATVTPGLQPTFTYNLTPPASLTLPQYILEATLDYSAHTVSVDEVINYPNLTGVELSRLVLVVEPNLWRNCFKLNGLMVSGQAVEDYQLSTDRLDLPLPSPLAPGASVNILLHFDLALPPADAYHIFGYNEMQTNLVDWYPFVAPYSNGWILHLPADLGEHLVYEAADFNVTFHLADSASTITLAAGAPAEKANGAWHYHLAHGRTFALSASPFYQKVSASVDGINVSGYYFESEKDQAAAAISQVGQAADTFSRLFGPYPYESLSMVESPYFDGMEFDGLFFLSRDYYVRSDGTVLNNLIDIAVHETAHQWWFGSVGNDQALQPWLDEALATYSEKLFYEQDHPDVSAWQAFRVDSWEPSGWVDTDIYHGVNFRTYANAVYLRGALFLQALRDRMGEAAFYAFLKDYAAQMGGKLSTSADFFRILGGHTSADLSAILSEYFSHPPH